MLENRCRISLVNSPFCQNVGEAEVNSQKKIRTGYGAKVVCHYYELGLTIHQKQGFKTSIPKGLLTNLDQC